MSSITAMLTDEGDDGNADTDIGDGLLAVVSNARYTYCTALLKLRGGVTRISEKYCSDGNE